MIALIIYLNGYILAVMKLIRDLKQKQTCIRVSDIRDVLFIGIGSWLVLISSYLDNIDSTVVWQRKELKTVDFKNIKFNTWYELNSGQYLYTLGRDCRYIVGSIVTFHDEDFNIEYGQYVPMECIKGPATDIDSRMDKILAHD